MASSPLGLKGSSPVHSVRARARPRPLLCRPPLLVVSSPAAARRPPSSPVRRCPLPGLEPRLLTVLVHLGLLWCTVLAVAGAALPCAVSAASAICARRVGRAPRVRACHPSARRPAPVGAGNARSDVKILRLISKFFFLQGGPQEGRTSLYPMSELGPPKNLALREPWWPPELEYTPVLNPLKPKY